jgi:hypothetical protein
MQPQADVHEHHTPTGPGHESSELKLRGLVIFGFALILLGVVVTFITGGFIDYFRGEEARLARLRPKRFADTRGQFPLPRLQGNPAKDTREFLAAEQAKLQEYGWSDAKAKVATIPIDRAIDLVLEKGLPTEKGESKKPEASAK